MPRIINFEGRKITLPDDATDDEVSHVLGGGNAATPPSAGAPSSFLLGAQKGFGDVMANVGGAADAAGRKVGLPMDAIEGALNKYAAPADAPHTLDEVRNPQNYANTNPEGYQPSTAGRIAGGVFGTLPTMALSEIPGVGPALAGAAGGALTTDPSAGESYATNAGVGAVGGAALHGASKLFAPAAKEAVPSLQDLRQGASDAYAQFDKSGQIVAAPSIANLVQGLQSTLANEGLDSTLHPAATAALGRVAGENGNNVTFKGMDILRRIAGDATGAEAPADQRMAYFVKNGIDDFMNNLKPGDLVAGQGAADPSATVATLNNARGLYSRASATSNIQDLFDRAALRAPVTGDENALRSEFRQMALNKGRMAPMAAPVQDAVETVAKGTPFSNLLRMGGKFAPRGVVSTGLSIGTGLATGGPVGALALPLAGEVSRAGASYLTKQAAQKALETAALGRVPVSNPTPLGQAILKLGRFGAGPAVGGVGASQ